MDSLRGRSLLTLADCTTDEVRALLELSHTVKKQYHAGERPQRFTGRSLAMLFEKRSTRTRAAFETAFGEEGGHPVFLSNQDIQLGAKETVGDTARVLGRMFDIIEFRGFSQAVVAELAECSGVPVINGLTDQWHPTQALADLMTIEELVGALPGTATVYIGDGRNNVSNSLLLAAAHCGLHHTVVCPPSLTPDAEVVATAQRIGTATGARLTVSHDPTAIDPATRIVYTDVWVSMGEEDKSAERVKLLAPYRVTEEVMDRCTDAYFLHCLPAVRGNEMTADVIDGPRSRVFNQAENRKHTIKAIMLATLGLA